MSNETLTLHKMAENATTTLFLFQNATLTGQAHEHLLWKMAEEWALSGGLENLHAEYYQ
jgi:hypothetical protein